VLRNLKIRLSYLAKFKIVPEQGNCVEEAYTVLEVCNSGILFKYLIVFNQYIDQRTDAWHAHCSDEEGG